MAKSASGDNSDLSISSVDFTSNVTTTVGTNRGGGRSDNAENGGNGGDDGVDAVVGQSASNAGFRLRAPVALTILCAAVGVSAMVYHLTATNQHELFHQQYDGAASKVLTSFAEIVRGKFSAIGSLALQCSQYVQAQPNATWPNVVVADFQNRAYVARVLSGAIFTQVISIVTDAERGRYPACRSPLLSCRYISGTRGCLHFYSLSFPLLKQQLPMKPMPCNRAPSGCKKQETTW
jgi:hypothetical protein